MSVDTNDMVEPKQPVAVKPSRKAIAKRKPGVDPAKALARAMESVEKLEGQNHEAGEALRVLNGLWLSADAQRKKGDAEIALNHFDAALASLRKSLAAM